MNARLPSLLSALLILPAVPAAEDVIALWDFNAVPAVSGALESPPPSEGAGTAALMGGVTATFATGVPGEVAGRAWNLTRFPPQGGSEGTAGVRFAVSTVGRDRIRLRFQHRCSVRASGRVQLRVSVNGVDFEEVGVFDAPGADQWTPWEADLGGMAAAADNAAMAFEWVSVFGAGTNRYVAAGPGSSYATSGTWRLDDVTVLGEPVADPPGAPRIRIAPAGRNLEAGDTLRLGVGATGAGDLTYQWQRDGRDLTGETRAVLIRDPATLEDAGSYRVRVGNELGGVDSEVAVVVITPPPLPYEEADCAALHDRVRAPDFVWPGGTALMAVEGIVVTHANLGALDRTAFHLQDATGGIAVVWLGQTPESLPAAGSRVRVVGPVRQVGGLLQLVPDSGDPQHSVTVLEEGLPLPEPIELDVEWLTDPVRMESIEGRRVRVSDVTLDTRSPLFPNRGTSLTLTGVESGASVTLRVAGDSQTSWVDLAGRPKPEGPFSVTGVWSQSDSSRPHTAGYQLVPTRYADLVPVGPLPEVRWSVVLQTPVRFGDALTNAFTEQVLRPGESLRLDAEFSDAQGELRPGDGTTLPEGTQVTWATVSGEDEGLHRLRATVRFSATAAHAGGLHRLRLSAVGPMGVRNASWTVYVPTPAEQQVVLTEFLANPVVNTGAPEFNPLRREDWPPADDAVMAGRIGGWDEFVELVNLGPIGMNLGGWTLSDASRIQAWVPVDDPRAVVPSGGALILYGGPPDSHPPRLQTPSIPAMLPGGASAGNDGLGLNNTGDSLMIRNAEGHLVERIVYLSKHLAPGGSLSRWPVPDGPWSAHMASPGLPPEGDRWPVNSGMDQLRIQVRIEDGHLRLSWPAIPGATYSVREVAGGSGAWTDRATRLAEPEFSTPLDERLLRLFQVTVP